AVLGAHRYVIDGKFIRVCTQDEFESIRPEDRTRQQVDVTGDNSKPFRHIAFREGTSLREALKFLSTHLEKNIVVSAKVAGEVPVTDLYDVTFEEILKAILGTHKYVIDGKFIHVYTEEEFKALNLKDRVNPKVDAGALKSADDSKRWPHISFKEGMSLRDALRFLGEASKKNIVVSNKVGGEVPVTDLYDVTFEEALQAILGTNKYTIDGKLIRVYSKGEFVPVYLKSKTDVQIEGDEKERAVEAVTRGDMAFHKALDQMDRLRNGRNTPWDKVDQMVTELTAKYRHPDDQGLVYYFAVGVHGMSGLYQPEKCIEYAEKAEPLLKDPAKLIQLYIFWGDAIQRKHWGAGGEGLAAARRELAPIYLRGAKVAGDQNIPDVLPELPRRPEMARWGSSDGLPPDLKKFVEQERAEWQAQYDAWKTASDLREFQEEIMTLREYARDKAIQYYAKVPFDTAEFKEMATKIVQDEKEVDLLMGRLQRLIEKRTGQSKPRKTDLPVGGKKAWGEEVAGAKIRILEATQIHGRSDWAYPVVRLRLEGRNEGAAYLHLPDNGQCWQIEVNGVWYERPEGMSDSEKGNVSISRSTRLLDFNAGDSHSDLTVEIAGGWRRIPDGKEDEYARRQWHGFVVGLNDDYGEELVLKGGVNRMRVAITCPPSRAGGNTLRLVSNPVEIDIWPKEASAVKTEAEGVRVGPAVADILASFKTKLVEMSSDYPELADAKDIRIDGALEGAPLYGLDYLHNCRYWGKRGHEDTGPHAVHIEFRVTTQPKDGEGYNFQTTPPTETWPDLKLVGWTLVYLGKDASPGFEAKVREVLQQHVEMINKLNRRAKTIPPPNAGAMRVDPESPSSFQAVAWGEEVDDLQLGLSYESAKRAYRQGEIVNFEVHVRNNGEKAVELSYVELFHWGPCVRAVRDPNFELISWSRTPVGLEVWDPNGAICIMNVRFIRGDATARQEHISLGPGDRQSLGKVTFQIGPVPDGSRKTKYSTDLEPGTHFVTQTGKFGRAAARESWRGELTTGALPLTVLPAQAGAEPTEKKKEPKLRNEASWGQAVDGVAVRLRSRRASRRWWADEPYLFSMFEVDLRSERKRILPNSPGGSEFEIEWDGRWYAGTKMVDVMGLPWQRIGIMSGSCCIRGPGGTRRATLPLSTRRAGILFGRPSSLPLWTVTRSIPSAP
ncbi:MAG: hypothetical protein ACYS8Z_21395, partial [Planctomycetota bacterium]